MRVANCTGAIGGEAGNTNRRFQAVHSKHFQTIERRRIMKTQDGTDRLNPERKKGARPTLPADMALQILKTSLDYVKGSGLSVRLGNNAGMCVIVVEGAQWHDDTQQLCVTRGDDTHALMTHTAVTHTEGNADAPVE